MGFGKFWMKHGPGSVGATAKAIAQDFVKWKRELPKSSKPDLLRKTLLTRMNTYSMLGLQPLNQEQQEELLKGSEGKLAYLILGIILYEYPAVQAAPITAPKTYQTMLDVIREAVHDYAPGVE